MDTSLHYLLMMTDLQKKFTSFFILGLFFVSTLAFSSFAIAQKLNGAPLAENLAIIKSRISPDFPTEFRRFLENDFEVIAKITGDGGSRLHLHYFEGPVGGETYLKWLIQNIDYIKFDQNFGVDDGAAGLAVSPLYNFTFRRGIVLGPRYFELFQSGRIPLIIHETRHLIEMTGSVRFW